MVNGPCFNPYFIGWYSGSPFTPCKGKLSFLFQSLFYWMVLWKARRPIKWHRAMNVSILILLDGTLEVSLECLLDNGSLVSILILLDGTLEGNNLESTKAETKVSILILLDGTLEERVDISFNRDTCCFNPYFIGWYSGS